MRDPEVTTGFSADGCEEGPSPGFKQVSCGSGIASDCCYGGYEARNADLPLAVSL